LSMAEVTDCRTLIFHNTCAEGVAAVRAAKARGVKAFGEVCLAWLTHNSEVFKGSPVDALGYLLAPPLRSAEHQAALWKGLARGDLDIVSTDHAVMRRMPTAAALEFAEYFGVRFDVPPPDEKTPYDSEGNRLMPMLAPGGVEVRLPLMYSLGVLGGHIDLHRWVETCCSAPAKLFDLHRKGHILPGYDADIVIFDPDATNTYSVGNLHSNVDHSVWDGWTCKGVVEKTICRGSLVVDGGRFVGSKSHGKFLRRTIN
jgi:dihydropyrimidinase